MFIDKKIAKALPLDEQIAQAQQKLLLAAMKRSGKSFDDVIRFLASDDGNG